MSSAQRKLYRLLLRWFIFFRDGKISVITNTFFCDEVGSAQGLCVWCSSLQKYQCFSAVNKALVELLHCCRKTTPHGKSYTTKSAFFFSINSISAKDFCQKSCDTESAPSAGPSRCRCACRNPQQRLGGIC